MFDVNSGEILRVDPIVWDIIEDFHLDEKELIAKYTPQFTANQISMAYHEIVRARAEQDLFVPYHPHVEMPFSRQAVYDRVNSERDRLSLEVTEKCNFQCTYCLFNLPDSGVVYQGTRDMSWETARAAIDDYLQHRIASRPTVEAGEEVTDHLTSRHPIKSSDHILEGFIGFYGGEPLLNFPLIKRCTEYALDKAKSKIFFSITTNGYLLKGDIADFLAEHNFSVAVSLDGPASTHDRHRKTKDGLPTHAVVLDNLKGWIRKYRSKRHIQISTTLARDTDRGDVHAYFSQASWVPPGTTIMISTASPPYTGYYESDLAEQGERSRREAYEKYKEDLIRGRVALGTRT